jgi:hypothetical protein
MKYLPVLVFKLLTLTTIQASPLPCGTESDSTSYTRKQSPLKAVKSVSFERYQWDASVDASFVLPSFYQIYTNGYYGSNAYYGAGNGGLSNGYYGYNGYSGLYANTRSTRLMLRKNESVLNATNIPLRKGAYRAQLYLSGGNLSVEKDSILFSAVAGDYYFPKKASYLSLGMALGYEWQHPKGRFQLFYGYDVFARYSSFGEAGAVRNGRGRKEDSAYDYYSFSAGIAPTGGVKYFVSSQFSLSFEASYSLNYYRGEGTFSGAIANNVFGRNYQERGFTYGLTPVSAINATFHFGQTNP